MSAKEARRPGLVQAALDKKITNREGAKALGISVRQFRRLKGRYQTGGVRGLTHQNRGRPSARRLDPKARQRVVALLQGTYAGLNDHHLTEKLREIEGFDISRELVRRIRREEQIAPVRRRRPSKYRARRLREARSGALVLLDGSEFAWLGPTKPKSTLLGAIDDATGEIVGLCFRPHEDLHGYTELLRRIALTRGLPVQLYGDRLNVFVRNDKSWTLEEELAGVRKPTQFGTMLASLGIGYIAAGSPQAKGRIERLWQTLQDRLPAELRLQGVSTMAEADDGLAAFIEDFNQRFRHAPRETSVWRTPPRDLDHILACCYERVVARDNTAAIPGRWIQIPPGPAKRSYQGCRVEIRELLSGALLAFYQGRLIAQQAPPPGPYTLVSRRSGSSKERRVALGVDQARPPRPRTLAESSLSWTAPKPRGFTRPADNHPWHKPFTSSPAARGGRTKSRCR